MRKNFKKNCFMGKKGFFHEIEMPAHWLFTAKKKKLHINCLLLIFQLSVPPKYLPMKCI